MKSFFALMAGVLLLSPAITSCSSGAFRAPLLRSANYSDAEVAAQDLKRAQAMETNPETPYFGRGAVQRKTVSPRGSGISRGL